jgi:hypothetical protein
MAPRRGEERSRLDAGDTTGMGIEYVVTGSRSVADDRI